jgi:hypothetical protein
MSVDGRSAPRGGSTGSALQFIVAWAEERVGTGREAGRRRVPTALTPPQVALVARRAALLLGDRPLTHVTFGDLARLPALLGADGMPPAAARSACREIGGALCTMLGGADAEGLHGRAASDSHVEREELEMGERERQDEEGLGAEPAGEHGQRIPGRDFAGASYASTEREQTADRRGASERHRMDDAQNVGGEEQDRPRDES